jgi:hypothetical protein
MTFFPSTRASSSAGCEAVAVTRPRALHVVALAVACALLPPLPDAAQARDLVALVHDTAGEPVADAVVFVPDARGKAFPPPEEPRILDQINKEFVPHVLPILVGSAVRFPNRDAIHHHVYSFSKTKTFELQLYKGEPARPVLFDQVGVVKVGCNIHDWMSAVILVLPTPWFGKTDEEGKASLTGLPDEEHLEIMLFHERLTGSAEETKRPIVIPEEGPARVEWTVSLKPERKRPRSEFGY